MAEILDDEPTEIVLQEGESIGDPAADNLQTEDPISEEMNAEASEAVPEASNRTVDPEVPEKLQGKSAGEIAKMYQELELKLGDQGDLIGKQTHELNHLRQTVDAFALRENSTPAQPETKPIEEADFFSDPTNTVNRAIEQHPALRQAQEMAHKMTLAQGLATLQQRHPDLQQVVTSSGFKEWVNSSSARKARYDKADQFGDVEEADDLISTYKQLQQVETTAKEVGKKAQKQAVQHASTGAMRGNSDARTSKRIYNRRDFMKVLAEDEQKYYSDAFQEMMMAAYAEGRVR